MNTVSLHPTWRLLLLMTLLLLGCGGGSSSQSGNTGQSDSNAPASPQKAGLNVLTYHNDNVRDGLNSQETILTTANVNSTQFGKIGFFPVDGLVDAQPLYLGALNIGGVSHNVLYVASEHGSVYAFDADSGAVLWQVSLLGDRKSTRLNSSHH